MDNLQAIQSRYFFRRVFNIINSIERQMFILALFAFFITPADTHAQDEHDEPLDSHRHVLSANPFGLVLLPWYNGEYERRMKPSLSLGISASQWTDNFVATTLAFRYYPSQKVFQGIYVGPRIGIFRTTPPQPPNLPANSDTPLRELTDVQLGLGFEFGYAWLIGSEQNLSISIGSGATRLLGGESTAFPVLRFINLGWAF